ncbi:hypothetical protein HPP92_021087 [Vanilla planifolia]|uniref:Uncharacterized protein n=1 Tax=Vanilla planifolia TaxID=51239 RepID=A0A835PUY7_VANPL|nr:hypothetical protein HPP92_021087 [Vanilla planifolia]
MESGRRSSTNEQRERRRKTKKKGALPLAMFLSFNDRGIHPHCPNASNPYHKCDRHCFEKIPNGKNLLDAVRSGGNGREREMPAEKRGVNPNCANASNPYHNCAEFCGEENTLKKRAEKKIGKLPNCKYASNPYHECAKFCFEDTRQMEYLQDSMKLKDENEALIDLDRGLIPECIDASIPFQICPEDCFQNVPEKNQSEQVIEQKILEKERIVDYIERRGQNSEDQYACSPHNGYTDLPSKSILKRSITEGDIRLLPECKNAMNNSDVCAEFLLHNAPEKNRSEQGINKKNSRNSSEEKKVVSSREKKSKNPQYEYVSNPHHECDELCSKIMPERKTTEGVDPKRSFSYHSVSNNKFGNGPDKEQLEGVMKSGGETKEVVPVVKVHSDCQYSSNPYHVCVEYCIQNVPKKTLVGGDGVNPECQNASNPYHVCAEYCFQDVHNKDRTGRALLKSKGKKAVAPGEIGVNPECKNSSNPYHVCAEYCINDVPIVDKNGKAAIKLKEKMKMIPLEEGVNPECKHASNPYHVCAEYCSQSSPVKEQVMKTRSQQKMKKVFSNIETATTSLQCKYATNPYHECTKYCSKNLPNRQMSGVVTVTKTKEGKKEISNAAKGVDSKYTNASNLYHKSGEHSSKQLPENTDSVEGVASALTKEKKRNLSKEEIGFHDMDYRCKETSIQNRNFAKLSDRKVGIESIEASNPIHELVTNLQSDEENGIETKNLVDNADVKTVRLDATDLFKEWANYCSQHMITEKTGESKGYKSANVDDSNNLKFFEKGLYRGRLPCSFPALLLFFLGFLFGLLRCNEVTHSLVMPSEKNNGSEKMSHEQADPQCRIMSDSYHKCSEHCF